MAAVTATPTTRNDRPFRAIVSPVRSWSSAAKAASATTPPSLTQLPWTTSGWSTAAGAASRPTICTSEARPVATRRAAATGYGPLWAATPGEWASSARASGSAAATTSGPLVAARVVAYGPPAASRTTSARVSVVVAARTAISSSAASVRRRRRSRRARRLTRRSRPITVTPPGRAARRGCRWCRRSAGSRLPACRRASRTSGPRWPRSARRG